MPLSARQRGRLRSLYAADFVLWEKVATLSMPPSAEPGGRIPAFTPLPSPAVARLGF